MSKRDYYQVLGLSKSATTDDIKSAFKKLARQYHPDVNKEPTAEAKFKEISEAYEVLGNEEKRRQYDQFGHFDFGGSGPQNPYNQQYWQNVNINFEDLFGDILGGMGGGRRARNTRGFDFGGFGGGQYGSKGSDLLWSLSLPLEEAMTGTEKQLLLPNNKKVKVKIPAGVDNGSKIRLAGQGNPGVGNGSAGDLIIEIKVTPSTIYKRDGLDVYTDLKISLKDALIGIKAEVTTLHGAGVVTIPKNVQSGYILRLRDKGIKDKNQTGHHYVRVLVIYPDFNSEDYEQIMTLLQKYAG